MYPLRLTTVLAATDFSDQSKVALRSAARLCRAAGGKMHVAYAGPEPTAILSGGGERAGQMEKLTDFVSRIGEVAEHEPHVLIGDAARSLTALAERVDADVIVTGRRREEARTPDRPLGGTAYAVITHAVVPCLAIAEPLVLPLRRVLIATDGSEASRGAMLVALSWASALRSRSGGDPTMKAVHVLDGANAGADSGAQQFVEGELELVRKQAGAWAAVRVTGTTAPGTDVAPVLAGLANEYGADLVVIGTRGIGDHPGGELGSVAAGLLARVNAPVLLVPPPVWREYAGELRGSQ